MNDADARITEVEIADGRLADLVEPMGPPSGPAVLFLHWFDTEAPDGNRSQFREEATALARDHGVVSILPDGRFPWAEPPTDADADVARIRAEVAAHRAAVDRLVAHVGVDPTRIGLVGHDFGAMHGIALAAEDPRLAAVVVIAPTPRWGDWFLPFWPIAGDRYDYLRALGPLDPVNLVGAIAPRPLLLQFATDDVYIARISGMELARAAGEPKQLVSYDADHAVRAPEARADRAAFLERELGWLGS